jgi:hypothetical protein
VWTLDTALIVALSPVLCSANNVLALFRAEQKLNFEKNTSYTQSGQMVNSMAMAVLAKPLGLSRLGFPGGGFA